MNVVNNWDKPEEIPVNNLINARIETLKLTIDVPGQTIDDAMNPGLEDALPEIDDDYQKSRTGATSSSLFAIAAKLGRLTPCFKVHGF